MVQRLYDWAPPSYSGLTSSLAPQVTAKALQFRSTIAGASQGVKAEKELRWRKENAKNRFGEQIIMLNRAGPARQRLFDDKHPWGGGENLTAIVCHRRRIR